MKLTKRSVPASVQQQQQQQHDIEAGANPSSAAGLPTAQSSVSAWTRLVLRRRPRLGAILGCMLLLCIIISMIPGESLESWLISSWVAHTWTQVAFDYALVGRLFSFWDARSAQHHAHAKAYFAEQGPLVMESARTHRLHAYFARTAAHVRSPNPGYYDMIGWRMQAMAELLDERGWDDFKVEKDKCIMYKFFEGAGIPIHPVVGTWTSKEKFLSDLRAGTPFTPETKFPVFIKACHLTAGIAQSTKRLDSIDEHNVKGALNSWEELEAWVESKWRYIPDDAQRPWRHVANRLTDVLTPGLMIQESAGLSFNPIADEWQTVEFKVSVLWGRAYIADLVQVGDGSFAGALVTRDNNGTIETFPDVSALLTQRGEPLPPNHWHQFILREGHLQCVWDLAERVSRIMGIDDIRVDIFVTEGKPGECYVNEDSLSSGSPYGGHMAYMARMWAGPHYTGLYREEKLVYDNGLRVYEQTKPFIDS